MDLRQPAKKIADSPAFSRAIIALLVLNAVALGCKTSATVSSSLDGVLDSIEVTVVTIFVVEMVIKIYAYRRSFFRDPWNWFDLVVICLSIMPASGTMLMFRTIRILRTFRLISAVPTMRRMVSALFTAVPGLMSILALLLLVLYTAAVAAVQMFGEVSREHFGSLGKSLFTMFRVMTMDGWSEITEPITDVRPLALVFFIGYIVITGFIVLNLFIAVIVNAMEKQVSDAHWKEEQRVESGQHQELLDELRAMRAELAELRAERRGATAPGANTTA